MEFKRHANTGVFYLIEINARHNLSAALAIRCGVNFPVIDYEYRTRGLRPAPGVAQTGVYWIDFEWDLREGRRLASRGQLPRNYLRPYVRPHVHDVLDWQDRAPFLKLIQELAMKRYAGDA